MTNPEEKAAMEWLDHLAAGQFRDWHVDLNDAIHARTLKRLLARPVLPELPTQAALLAMGRAWLDGKPDDDCWPYVYRALYAHLTAPRTKEVEVWHVEYADEDRVPRIKGPYLDRATAECVAGSDGRHTLWTCIRVTGPHKQMVPS